MTLTQDRKSLLCVKSWRRASSLPLEGTGVRHSPVASFYPAVDKQWDRELKFLVGLE